MFHNISPLTIIHPYKLNATVQQTYKIEGIKIKFHKAINKFIYFSRGQLTPNTYTNLPLDTNISL